MKSIHKKIICVICSLVVLLATSSFVYATGTSVSVGNYEVEEKNGNVSVEVPIILSGNTGVCGFQLAVSYADELTLENVSKGDAFSVLAFTKPKDLTDNPIMLPWDGEGEEDKGNGIVATLTFSVPAGSAATYPITVDVKSAYDYDLNDLTVSVTNGSITVKSSGDSDPVTPSPDPDVPEETPDVGDAVEDTKVNLYVVSADETAGSVNISGVNEVEIKTDVEVIATPNPGYKFSHWRNYAGTVLSVKEKDTFTINTNTAIYAEFDKILGSGDKIPIYFYNGNGLPHAKAEVDKGTDFKTVKTGVETPELTGYKFLHWSMYEDESAISDNTLVNDVINAVAIFGDTDKRYTVKVNGQNYKTDAKYGEKVTVTSSAESFKCWKLGDKVVSYDSSYEFYVWDDVSLTTESTGEKAPVAIMSTAAGNPMLIYSVPEEYEIVEAGILFGSTKEIHIGSTDGSKAVAKKGTGQFTAQPHIGAPETTVARGYMIFKTPDKELRVLYTD